MEHLFGQNEQEKENFDQVIKGVKESEKRKRKAVSKKKASSLSSVEAIPRNADSIPEKRPKKKRTKRRNVEAKRSQTFHDTQTYESMHPSIPFRMEEIEALNNVNPFEASYIVSLLDNTEGRKLHSKEYHERQNKETRMYMGLSEKQRRTQHKFSESYFKGKEPSSIEEEKITYDHYPDNPASSNTAKYKATFKKCLLGNPLSKEDPSLYIGEHIASGSIMDTLSCARQQDGTGSSDSSKGEHEETISKIVRSSDDQRIMSLESNRDSLFTDDKKCMDDQKKLALDATQVISPMRDLNSHLTSCPSKTARQLLERAAYGVQDAVNFDIESIAKTESQELIKDRKEEITKDAKKVPRSNPKNNPVSKAFSEDKPLDPVDGFYTGQLVGPSLRELVRTMMEESERAEKAASDEYLSGEPLMKKEGERQRKRRLLMGPKERLIRFLINNERQKDELYRWRAYKGFDMQQMHYQPMGDPVSMEYALEFLREPVGDERSCIRGANFCVSMLLPQMYTHPRTSDTQLSDMGFVGREFFTKNELDIYLKRGSWPEMRGCCFLCLSFEQTMKCATVIETRMRFPYQIQRFTILIEEGKGFSHNQMLPQLTAEDEPTGIVGAALEFRTNDYIPTTTRRHVGTDIVKVKCYNFTMHLF